MPAMVSESSYGVNPRIELRCRIDGSMLGPLREFVSNIARHLGFADREVGEIEICVDEACANALEHGYLRVFGHEDPAEGRDLSLEIFFQDGELTVRVIDYGCGSQSRAHPRVHDLKEYVERDGERYRGLGLFLIHKFMDRVDVRTGPGQGTTVEMTKIRR
jgi:anti-sigma regulatory factor (Ser/Thr protein kinase)